MIVTIICFPSSDETSYTTGEMTDVDNDSHVDLI